MANDDNRIGGQITQIKIGNSFYNIKDAAVWEVLKNISDNTMTLHVCGFSNWTETQNLLTNRQIESSHPAWKASGLYINPIGINECKLWLDPNGFLYFYYSKKTDDRYSWNQISITETPTTINQCAIFSQYRIRIAMKGIGSICPQVLRRLLWSTEAPQLQVNTTLAYNQNDSRPYTVFGPSKVTNSYPFSSSHYLQTGTVVLDKIVKNSSRNNGAAYRIAIADWIPNGTGSNYVAKYNGSSVRVLLMAAIRWNPLIFLLLLRV